MISTLSHSCLITSLNVYFEQTEQSGASVSIVAALPPSHSVIYCRWGTMCHCRTLFASWHVNNTTTVAHTSKDVAYLMIPYHHSTSIWDFVSLSYLLSTLLLLWAANTTWGSTLKCLLALLHQSFSTFHAIGPVELSYSTRSACSLTQLKLCWASHSLSVLLHSAMWSHQQLHLWQNNSYLHYRACFGFTKPTKPKSLQLSLSLLFSFVTLFAVLPLPLIALQASTLPLVANTLHKISLRLCYSACLTQSLPVTSTTTCLLTSDPSISNPLDFFLQHLPALESPCTVQPV